MTRGPMLMVPGPTPVDPSILEAMGRAPLHFTSKEFVRILLETRDGLRAVMRTEGDVVILAGSGTMGMESAIVNVLGNGDRALVVSHGKWGERLVTVCRCYGVDVTLLSAEPGEIVPLSAIESALKDGSYKALLVTHVETSTGVRAPVREIGVLAREHGCLYLVDGVSSTGAEMEPMDEWGIDVLMAASQKALGCPPGLTMLGISPRAVRARLERASIPNHYGDWLEMLRVFQNPTVETHVTHPVNAICALHQGVRLLLEDGLDRRIADHHRRATAVRAGLRAMGFQPLAREEIAANTVTVGLYPPGVEDGAFRATLELNGVLVASTGGSLAGKGVRLGHMGYITDLDIVSCLSVFERTLEGMGHEGILGKGVAAAERILR